MSKALIFSSANFSTNKIETITFGASLSCTGIELSENAISFSTLNDTETLTATLTPSNTTDTLTWESSDTSVATVASGVVTCVGLGSSIVTATCGSQTATCTVTVASITVDGTQYEAINGYQLTSTDLTLDPPKNYSGLYTSQTGRIYFSDTSTPTGNKAFCTDYADFIGGYPIIMPKNTGIIEIQATSDFKSNGKIVLFDSTAVQTYLTGSYANKPCALVKQYTTGIAPSSGKYVFTVTESNVDSFAVQIGSSKINTITLQSGDIIFTFKPVETT